MWIACWVIHQGGKLCDLLLIAIQVGALDITVYVESPPWHADVGFLITSK